MNESNEKLICETCGSTDIKIDRNICMCNICGNKWLYKFDNDEKKLDFYVSEINQLINDKKFDEAENNIKKALELYPNAGG